MTIKQLSVPIIGLIILSIPFIFRACIKKTVTPKTIITSAVYSKPTAAQEKILPGVLKVIDIPHLSAPLGYVVKQSVLEGVSKTVIVSSDTVYLRYSPSWGLYLDGTLNGAGAGLKYSPLGYWRVDLDGLVGYPDVGIGLSFQLFKNTYIGGSYNENYTKLTPEPGVYVSLNF